MPGPDLEDDEPEEDEFEDYDDDELDEFEELNSSDATATFLDQRWFRWAAIGIAALVVMSFSLPVLAPFFDNNAPAPADTNEPTSLPDFILPTADGGDIRLTERAAPYSTVVLIFHRGFDCSGCRAQLAELQSGYNDVRIEGAEVLAIALDNQLNTQRLAQQLGVRFPMLVDESGVVASSYGLRDALEADFTTAILILNGDLQLLASRLATDADQTLPVEAIVNAIREANGTGDKGGTAS